jgi:hypothetical protein
VSKKRFEWKDIDDGPCLSVETDQRKGIRFFILCASVALVLILLPSLSEIYFLSILFFQTLLFFS